MSQTPGQTLGTEKRREQNNHFLLEFTTQWEVTDSKTADKLVIALQITKNAVDETDCEKE